LSSRPYLNLVRFLSFFFFLGNSRFSPWCGKNGLMVVVICDLMLMTMVVQITIKQITSRLMASFPQFFFFFRFCSCTEIFFFLWILSFYCMFP